MMLSTQQRAQNSGGKSLRRKILLYIFLLLFGWIVLMFVVIPWDSSGHLPQGSFELIEGQRAYAMIVRQQRPTLAATIRGLNMVGVQFTQEQDEMGRHVQSGNIRLYFDHNGEFLHIEILKKPLERPQ